MNNTEIRMMIMQSGYKYYEVASKLGISESYFSRLLREELSEDRKEKIVAAVNSLKEGCADAV